MPRYFLHVRDRVGCVCDEDGFELADLETAVVEARRGIRSLLSESVKAGFLDLDGCVEISGRDGVPMLVVPFSDAITITRPGRPRSGMQRGGQRD